MPIILRSTEEITIAPAVPARPEFINPNGGGAVVAEQKSGPMRRTFQNPYVRTFRIGKGPAIHARRRTARKKKWIPRAKYLKGTKRYRGKRKKKWVPYKKYMAQKRRYKYGRYTRSRY